MKILINSIVDLRNSQHNRPHQMVKYLSEKHDVTVLSIYDHWKGEQGDLVSYSSNFNDIFERIDYHFLTKKRISPILQELFFKKKMENLIQNNKFDIHLNYNSLVSGYRTSKGIKTVFDLADDLPEMIKHSPQIPRLLRYFGKEIGGYYLKKNICSAEYVTLTTRSLENFYNIPENKAVLIPNGVDTSIFKKINKAKENLGLSGFIVGYVGVLREWVDLESVFRALKLLDKDIKLLIVGGEGQFKESIELADRFGVLDRVKFTGMVPYNEVPKYISAMDVCLIPFKNNDISKHSLPMKLFEYMACEKPVISSNIPAIKTILGDIVLYASDYNDYVDKINILYKDADLRKKKGKAGRKVAENNSWKEIVCKLEGTLIKAFEG